MRSRDLAVFKRIVLKAAYALLGCAVQSLAFSRADLLEALISFPPPLYLEQYPF